MKVRRQHIRNLAASLVEKNQIRTPPIPVARIARAEGLSVVMRQLDGEISGFLARPDRTTGLIGVNSRHPKVRQRFTIAHEIGHFFLSEDDALHVDHGFPLQLRSEVSAKGIDRDEVEANLFAAELLMPASFFLPDLEAHEPLDVFDEKTIRQLAKKYDVSTHSLLLRIQNLR